MPFIVLRDLQLRMLLMCADMLIVAFLLLLYMLLVLLLLLMYADDVVAVPVHTKVVCILVFLLSKVHQKELLSRDLEYNFFNIRRGFRDT